MAVLTIKTLTPKWRSLSRSSEGRTGPDPGIGGGGGIAPALLGRRLPQQKITTTARPRCCHRNRTAAAIHLNTIIIFYIFLGN